MRDRETRCASFTSRETQTACGRKIDLIENTNCERQAVRFQTIFERDKRFVRAGRLNNQKTRGIEAKAHQPSSRWPPKLTRQHARPAPQDPRRAKLSTIIRNLLNAPDRKAERKAEACHPSSGDRARYGHCCFHFVQTVRFETLRQKGVGRRVFEWTAELPFGA